MGALLLIGLIIAALVAATVTVYASRSQRKDRLDKVERHELNTLREMRDAAEELALDQSSVGDPVGLVLLDVVNKQRRQMKELKR